MFACFVFVSLLISIQANAKIDPATCVGAWLLNEAGAETSEDISGNGNHVVIKGKPKWDEGKFGKAIDFDGVDDYIECPDNDTLDVGTVNFTVVSWIKCAKYNPGDWEAQIVYKFDHTAPRHGYLLGVRGSLDAANQNKPVFILGLGDSSGIHLFGTKPINDGNWHHLAVSVDRNSSMIMYRDGEMEAQQNISAFAKQNEDNAKAFNIGCESGVPSRTIKSVIDEVALFKAILSQEDIINVMNNGLERIFGAKSVSYEGKLPITWANIKQKGYNLQD